MKKYRALTCNDHSSGQMWNEKIVIVHFNKKYFLDIRNNQFILQDETLPLISKMLVYKYGLTMGRCIGESFSNWQEKLEKYMVLQ
uniref:Uncharacterized protein n=1 Tax=Romanomermis culicivorax TaxID=13658 RepID=A0A915I1V1_ROMCU